MAGSPGKSEGPRSASNMRRSSSCAKLEGGTVAARARPRTTVDALRRDILSLPSLSRRSLSDQRADSNEAVHRAATAAATDGYRPFAPRRQGFGGGGGMYFRRSAGML